MKTVILGLLVAANSFAGVYTFDEFCDEVYKNNLTLIDAAGDKNAARYDKEAAMAFEQPSLEFGGRKIKTDESKNDREVSGMIGFSTKMPWIRTNERKSYEAREKGLETSERLQKALLKSGIKRSYLMLLLCEEEERIYADKESAAKRSFEMAKKKFASGRISAMELARFETELMQSRVDLASATAAKEEYHHELSHAVLSHDEISIRDLEFHFYGELTNKLEKLGANSLWLQELEDKRKELEYESKMYKNAIIDKVDFGVGYTREPDQKSVDFRMAIPLNITGKNENKIAALRAKLNAVTKKQKVLQDKFSIMARAEGTRISELEKKIKTSGANEQLYKSLFEMTAKGYEGGAVSLFEYIAAKNAYFDAGVKTISYKKEYIEEIAKLENVFAGVIQ